MNQTLIEINDDYSLLGEYLKDYLGKSIFVVCGKSFDNLKIKDYLYLKDINYIRFSDFTPNPTYDEVLKGLEEFKKASTDLIIAIGGGSGMDVAKCIKAFSTMNNSIPYINQEIKENSIKLWALPTTSGTGSEATRFAVIYKDGIKQTIDDYSLIPSIAILDPSTLKTLPLFQKKCTMLDALSHSIESYWSINSNDESKEYSKEAIKLILENKDEYLNNIDKGNEAMLKAAYIAGKAINITKTTAGHAMCYKLTGLYGIPHGYACGLVNSRLYPFMVNHLDKCIDVRGKEYLENTFNELKEILGESNDIEEFINSLKLDKITNIKIKDLDILTNSVNLERLRNNPIKLEKEDINYLYREILKI